MIAGLAVTVCNEEARREDVATESPNEPVTESVNEPIVEQPSDYEIIKEVNASGTITNEQAESLSKVEILNLNGRTSITNEQAESLILKGINLTLYGVHELSLNGLTSITDAQAESMSKVRLI